MVVARGHYCDGVTVPDDYREFFVAAAGASGALIGLLFVAVSVFPERARRAETRLDYQSRASAALVLFSNAMVLSLAALVPGVNLGWWALASSLVVLVFGAATARLIVTAVRQGQGRWGSLGLVVALALIGGFELYAGIRLIGDPADPEPIRTLDYVVIGDLAAGVARAWQLVSMRDTGLMSSLRILASGDDQPGDTTD
jgi:hypothetical protein